MKQIQEALHRCRHPYAAAKPNGMPVPGRHAGALGGRRPGAGADPTEIGDVVGCAMPRSRAGHERGAHRRLLAGLPNTAPGITINRFARPACRPWPTPRASAWAKPTDDRRRHREHDRDAQIMGNKISSTRPSLPRTKTRHRLRHGSHRREGRPAVGIDRAAQDAFARCSPIQRAAAAIAAGAFHDDHAPHRAHPRAGRGRQPSASPSASATPTKVRGATPPSRAPASSNRRSPPAAR